ncbi:MAG TPA: hypothetical protein VG406_03230 [Isosphaeraceae bacterium]|jgi:hypothetical protein|nr:hypothetical protein [Isosphaeraceae bacterium]
MPLAAWAKSIDLPLVLLLAYLVALWVGGWALERLARAHHRKAQRFAHQGFAYDPVLDHYECPQGELLTLHTCDDRDKLAIYKAPASSCNSCVLKDFCTPHDAGRHVYRSLAEFYETDVGRLHHRVSLLALATSILFALGGVLAHWNRPGEVPLLAAACVGAVLLWREVRRPASAPADDR